jgi:hypothetical protein
MAVHVRRTIGVLALTVVVAAAGCGGSAAPDGLAPPEAADALARNLNLDADQTACMRDRFEQAPSAAAVLATEESAADADRDLFLAAIRACLPPDAFGTTLATTVRSELTDATDAQATCVHDNVVALAAPEQDRLYLYFSNPAGLDVADVGPAGVDLLASCDLMPTDAGTAEPPTTTAAP